MPHSLNLPGVQLPRDGGSSVQPPPVKLPVRVLRKHIDFISMLASGSFGEVWLAICPLFGHVAIKMVKPDLLVTHSDALTNEAELMHELSHPNVVACHGFMVESMDSAGIAGIIMEHMAGSLTDLLHCQRMLQQQPLPLAQRVALAIQVAEGMAYVHEHGLVHLDVKPPNILVGRGGGGSSDSLLLKLADFGLSKHKEEGQEYVEADYHGTLIYMAPEVVADVSHVSDKADVWAMGVVMWEMLTLAIPHGNMTDAQIVQAMFSGNLVLQLPAGCEPEWQGLVEACIIKALLKRLWLQYLAWPLICLSFGCCSMVCPPLPCPIWPSRSPATACLCSCPFPASW
jgi:serine/threonine protein kinase